MLAAVLLGMPVSVSACAETVWGDLNARYANVPQLEYNGMRYRLNRRVTAILLAGTDKNGDVVKNTQEHRNGGQADFLLLVAIDDNAGKVQCIQIDRDTMAEIAVLNVLGEVSGSRNAQICLAHSFGDGMQRSCELLAEAVTGLLKGTPVEHYFVMNLDGIAALNDALGGVELTLEHDFTAYDTEMTAGRAIKLNGAQAEIYVRQRYSIGKQTNADRQQRQRTYMCAASEILMRRVLEDAGFVSELFDALAPYAQTDMGKGRLLNYIKTALDYEILPIQSVEGIHQIGSNGFMEFIPDEEALMKLIIDTFYEPMK